jgi:hypothetical protein
VRFGGCCVSFCSGNGSGLLPMLRRFKGRRGEAVGTDAEEQRELKGSVRRRSGMEGLWLTRTA